ncbi:Coenzyme F420 hydrogenase/dehydrogenase, beta subunit C-terminal domain [uncultured Bacteroides sp.]|uniref:Coenzyme F420 hydrogenase/dehydrogenase, beta subunit C-terminal domain n=1 Tax=uncultured Bacteroides sp. TaxID=162156 RepID=UPI002674A800|nr:Coenzyme F420 hydrogenase/dehydrogenase, beta subunit C-terminal domain [uncultured Bacteroides sp.]
MINITDKVECCGCNACGDICPKNAITFKTDIEGFWYPIIDTEKCIGCDLCDKTCPIINIKELKKNDLPQSVCYAAEHKNIEVIFDSTSGGLFSALADIMYHNGGYVGGAIFNEDFSVKQYLSNNKADLPKLRSSKYLQSNFEGFFKQIRDLVKSGESVLVCGSPCQMAALRIFLGKNFDNLIIVDYICRGINSPKVWKKYLDSFEERYGYKVVYCKAKSKEYGWRNLTQKVILSNGKAYYETKDQSKFTQGYLSTGVYCRPSCYDCKFKGYPRISDITLADFWGIENINKLLEKDLGTSLVMVNSQKGEKYFEKVKQRINYIQVPFDSIEAGNRSLNLSLDLPRVDRTQFFKDLDKMSFVEISEKYIANSTSSFSLKRKIKNHVIGLRSRLRIVQYSPSAVLKLFALNKFEEIVRNKAIIPTPYCCIQIGKGARIIKEGNLILGWKKIPKSKLETRLLVNDGATLEILGNTVIGYGSDIEVFSGGKLTFKGGSSTNINATLICAEKIEIGKDVMLGRNVTIRDNNGNHYINRAGYKNSRPVIIGDKVWLCEGCTIMPGVKIGDGAIIGAHAFVTQNVPAHAVVSGNPAVVVDEDVLWKY